MWYVAPLRVQKLILFLLQHGTKNFTIILGGFFVSSLEGFATVRVNNINGYHKVNSYLIMNIKIKNILDTKYIFVLFYGNLLYTIKRRRNEKINISRYH